MAEWTEDMARSGQAAREALNAPLRKARMTTLAEIMCGRVMKRHSPSFMSGQSASGMSLGMGGGLGSMMGGSQSGADEAAAKTKKSLASAMSSLSVPRFTPSWRK